MDSPSIRDSPHLYEELLKCVQDQKKIQQQQYETLVQMSTAFNTQLKFVQADHCTVPNREAKSDDEAACQALLKVAISESAARAEGWKTGLDVKLIFIALFVAVITAFQIPAAASLSRDPADRTNDLLGNLTTIVIRIAALNGLQIPDVEPQQPQFKILKFALISTSNISKFRAYKHVLNRHSDVR